MKRNKFIYLLAFSAVMLLGACSELSDKDCSRATVSLLHWSRRIS